MSGLNGLGAFTTKPVPSFFPEIVSAATAHLSLPAPKQLIAQSKKNVWAFCVALMVSLRLEIAGFRRVIFFRCFDVMCTHLRLDPTCNDCFSETDCEAAGCRWSQERVAQWCS